MLARVLDPAAYPLASRVGSAAGAAHGSAADPDHAYRFGLDRVLDGLAAFVGAATAAAAAADEPPSVTPPGLAAAGRRAARHDGRSPVRRGSGRTGR